MSKDLKDVKQEQNNNEEETTKNGDNELTYVKELRSKIPSNFIYKDQAERNEWYENIYQGIVRYNLYEVVKILYYDTINSNENVHPINLNLSGMTTLEASAFMLLSLGASLHSRANNNMTILYNLFGEKSVGKSVISNQTLSGFDFLILEVANSIESSIKNNDNEGIEHAKNIVRQYYKSYNIFEKVGLKLSEDEFDRLVNRFIDSVKEYSKYMNQSSKTTQGQLTMSFQDMIKDPSFYSYHGAHPTQLITGMITDNGLKTFMVVPDRTATILHDPYSNIKVDGDGVSTGLSNVTQRLADAGFSPAIIVTTNNITPNTLETLAITAGISPDGDIVKEGHVSRAAGINIPIVPVMDDTSTRTDIEWKHKSYFLDDAATLSLLISIFKKEFGNEYGGLFDSILSNNISEAPIIEQYANNIRKIIMDKLKQEFKDNTKEMLATLAVIIRSIRQYIYSPNVFIFYDNYQLALGNLLKSFKVNGKYLLDDDDIKNIRELCNKIMKYDINLGKYLACVDSLLKFVGDNSPMNETNINTINNNVLNVINNEKDKILSQVNLDGNNDIKFELNITKENVNNNTENRSSRDRIDPDEITRRSLEIRRKFMDTIIKQTTAHYKMQVSDNYLGYVGYLGPFFKTFADNLSNLIKSLNADSEKRKNYASIAYHITNLNALGIVNSYSANATSQEAINDISEQNINKNLSQNRMITQFLNIMTYIKSILEPHNYTKFATKTVLSLFGGINLASISMLESLGVISKYNKFEIKNVHDIFYDFYCNRIEPIYNNYDKNPYVIEKDEIVSVYVNDMVRMACELTQHISKKKKYDNSQASMNAVINNFYALFENLMKDSKDIDSNAIQETYIKYYEEYIRNSTFYKDDEDNKIYNNLLLNQIKNKDLRSLISYSHFYNMKKENYDKCADMLQKLYEKYPDAEKIIFNDIKRTSNVATTTAVISKQNFFIDVYNMFTLDKNSSNTTTQILNPAINQSTVAKVEILNFVLLNIDPEKYIQNEKILELNIDKDTREEIEELLSIRKHYMNLKNEIDKTIEENNNSASTEQAKDRVYYQKIIDSSTVQLNRILLNITFPDTLPPLYEMEKNIVETDVKKAIKSLDYTIDYIKKQIKDEEVSKKLEIIVKSFMAYNFMCELVFKIDSEPEITEKVKEVTNKLSVQTEKENYRSFKSSITQFVEQIINQYKRDFEEIRKQNSEEYNENYNKYVKELIIIPTKNFIKKNFSNILATDFILNKDKYVDLSQEENKKMECIYRFLEELINYSASINKGIFQNYIDNGMKKINSLKT